MILRPKFSSPRHAVLSGTASAVPGATVPGWLRRSVPDAQSLADKVIEDVALAAGAAITALDAVIRRQELWSGASRMRLALVAAAATAKHMGRVEDEAALLLTKLGDESAPPAACFWRGVDWLPSPLNIC